MSSIISKPSSLKLYGLITLATILVVVHIGVVIRMPYNSLISGSILTWAVSIFLVWERRKQLLLISSPLAYILGIAVAAIALSISLSLQNYHTSIRFIPLLSCLGLGLIASGYQGLKQYQQELTIFLLTAIPPGLVNSLTEWDIMTAKVSHFLLHYIGFEVYRKESLLTVGSAIATPDNTVNVAIACAGTDTMMQLWVLAILGIFLVPTTFRQKLAIPVVALVVAYGVNAIRVAILAALRINQPLFDYWHIGQGGQIFPFATIVIWGLICKFIIMRTPPINHQESN